MIVKATSQILCWLFSSPKTKVFVLAVIRYATRLLFLLSGASQSNVTPTQPISIDQHLSPSFFSASVKASSCKSQNRRSVQQSNSHPPDVSPLRTTEENQGQIKDKARKQKKTRNIPHRFSISRSGFSDAQQNEGAATASSSSHFGCVVHRIRSCHRDNLVQAAVSDSERVEQMLINRDHFL